jgi:hypothetical protein
MFESFFKFIRKGIRDAIVGGLMDGQRDGLALLSNGQVVADNVDATELLTTEAPTINSNGRTRKAVSTTK